MAAGLVITAIVLAICAVIMLLVVRADLKEQSNKKRKK